MKFRITWSTFGLTLILAISLMFYLILIIAQSNNQKPGDFAKFYASAELFINGESIYSPVFRDLSELGFEERYNISRFTLHPNLNLPFQTLIFVPFGLISYQPAFLLWSISSLLLGAVSVNLINNYIHEEFDVQIHKFILLLIFLIFFPTLTTFQLGQISILLFFLLTIAWISIQKNNPKAAGIILGIALSLKIFTGLFIIFFLIRRQWTLLKWYLGTFIMCNLISIFIFGYQEHLKYLSVLNSITWYGASWNASFMGYFSRIFGGSENPPIIPIPALTQILSLGFTIITIGIIYWAARPHDDEPNYIFDLSFSLTIISMLLISPLGWMYYFVILLIPLVVSWQVANINQKKLQKFFLIVAWLCCTVPHPLVKSVEIDIAITFIWAGFYFYGLILFLLVIITQIYQAKQNSGYLRINVAK